MADPAAKNDEKSTTLIAFDDYHGGRAKTRKLVYTIFGTDKELVDSLKNKKIDIAETLTFPATKTELTAAGFTVTEYESPGVFGLYMNTRRSDTTVLKNKEMRKAIALAMNRQALVDEVGNKNTPATQVIPKSLPGYDATISFPAFDLAAAKAALTKAGYKSTTALDFAYVKDVQQDAPVIIKQLRAAGIKINEKVFTSDQTEQLFALLQAGTFDFFSGSYASDLIDARDLLGSLLHSTESSYPVYKDAAYDKLLTDSDSEFDPVKRTQKLQEANKYIADNFAWVPLRNGVYAAYYGKDLDITIDFTGGGNLGTYYRKVGRIE
jgi:ABC-type transport system substrate-binding protein